MFKYYLSADHCKKEATWTHICILCSFKFKNHRIVLQSHIIFQQTPQMQTSIIISITG